VRPRGLPSSWINVSATYGTDKNQPSRQREREQALAYEAAVDDWRDA
jgi:hypothetical protein